MDISNVKNLKAKAFLNSFFIHRKINREFYFRIPEDKFDFRMVDSSERKSDSPRESLAHQINVERSYLEGAKTGNLKFGLHYDPNLKNKDKETLLKLLDEADQDVIEYLSNEENINKKVKVPWDNEEEFVVAMFWSLNTHEILHTGWNLAIMDHLNMERFPALKNVWG